MPDPPLDVRDDLAGIALVPMPVEVLGHQAELDDEVAGEVLRLDLAAFLPPEAEQGGLVIAHDDPGVRAADELATFTVVHWLQRCLRHSRFSSKPREPNGQLSILKVSHEMPRKSILKVSIRQIKAARSLLAWSQEQLAAAADVSIPTIKRLEAQDGPLGGRDETGTKIRLALETAGVEFIDENGGGPGVRLRKRQSKRVTGVLV